MGLPRRIIWMCWKFALLASPLVMVSPLHSQTTVFPQWIARFDARQFVNQTRAIAADADGNTYVTGSAWLCSDPCANREMLTIKYDPDGHLLWNAWLGTNLFAQGDAIKLDPQGNVYVLGELNGNEFVTVKYNTNGERQWAKYVRTPGNDNTPVNLAVGPTGNVYVTARSNPQGFAEGRVLTIKYDTNGDQLWERIAPLSFSDDNTPIDIGLDKAENVFVAANDVGFPSDQFHSGVILKYDSNGNFLKGFGGDLGGISAFRVDAQGNSYVAGGGPPSVGPGTSDPVVAKFDADGNQLFIDDFVSVSPNLAYNGIAVDSEGEIFVAQTIPGQAGASDISVLRLDAHGVQQWVTRYNGHADGSGEDVAVAIAVNSFGEPYVTGESELPAFSNRSAVFAIATIKYSRTGQQIWLQRYEGPHGRSVPTGMVIGGDGGLFVAGTSLRSTAGLDWVTIDYVQDAADVNPRTLTFGNQSLKTQSAPQTVTLRNSSEIDLDITRIYTSGDFHETNNCPSILSPGASCPIQVTFLPGAVGTLSGWLNVVDAWEGTPRGVGLTGTGVK